MGPRKLNTTWRDICRRSHMGAELNPASIALVAALDYPSATKQSSHSSTIFSCIPWGGAVPATRLILGSTAHQARFRWGGLVHLHAASRHRAQHSTFRRATCPYNGGVGRLDGGLLRWYPVREKKIDRASWGGRGTAHDRSAVGSLAPTDSSRGPHLPSRALRTQKTTAHITSYL